MTRVTVVDYGRGNLFSVGRALDMAGAEPVVTSDPAAVATAERLVLPGVGAFGDAVASLGQLGLADALRAFAATGRPLLGICLGMQILGDTSSEFGSHTGLGLVPGRVGRLPQTGGRPKIPSVGWCRLDPVGVWQGTLLRHTPAGEYCYFVHSYHLVAANPAHVLSTYDFGGRPVTAVVKADNVTGCQFHPEKSGVAGARMLSAWLEE